jgi:hypothetical protein
MMRAFINTFSILITIIIAMTLQGCSESMTLIEEPNPPDYIIVGEDNQEYVQIYEPASEEIEFDLILENDLFRHFSASFDLNNDREKNLIFNLFILKDDNRKVLLIKPLSGIHTPVRFDLDAVNDENRFIDQVFSFPITRAVEKGVKIKTEDFDWTTERDLYALSQIRNSAGSPAGFRPFGDRTFLPIQYQDNIGYIEFKLNFDTQDELPSLHYKKTAVLNVDL